MRQGDSPTSASTPDPPEVTFPNDVLDTQPADWNSDPIPQSPTASFQLSVQDSMEREAPTDTRTQFSRLASNASLGTSGHTSSSSASVALSTANDPEQVTVAGIQSSKFISWTSGSEKDD